ncbi:MAG: DUF2116 family Zn-ribbon domain-containing protein [Bacteroidota bacterium]
MSKEKLCLTCGEEIKGRADKKFCDDQCRSNYNREQKVSHDQYAKRVNAALKKNRQILKEMNPDGMVKVLYKDMLQRGFDFGYFTSILKTSKKSYYFFVYEMGFLPINAEQVLLVKKENHRRMEVRR